MDRPGTTRRAPSSPTAAATAWLCASELRLSAGGGGGGAARGACHGRVPRAPGSGRARVRVGRGKASLVEPFGWYAVTSVQYTPVANRSNTDGGVGRMTASVAPAGVEPIRAFVNTCDRERGTEELASPAALGAWLAGRGLLDQDAAVTRAELRRAIELREALRAVLVAHAGRELDAAAPAVLERAARRARLEVRFDAGARARPEPLAPGIDGALGRLLTLVAAAQEDGT